VRHSSGVRRGRGGTIGDLAFVVWGISRTVDMTAGSDPGLWRRHLALLPDGFRAAAAHPLPGLPPRHQGHAAARSGNR
jgi:hypothetical protein